MLRYTFHIEMVAHPDESPNALSIDSNRKISIYIYRMRMAFHRCVHVNDVANLPLEQIDDRNGHTK